MKFILLFLISLNLYSSETYRCIDYEIKRNEKNISLFCFDEKRNTLEVFKLKAFQEEKLRESLKNSDFFIIKEIEKGIFQITVKK